MEKEFEDMNFISIKYTPPQIDILFPALSMLICYQISPLQRNGPIEYRERERGTDGWKLRCSKRVDNTSDGPKLRVWYGPDDAVSSANASRITHRVNNVAVRLAVRPYTHHFPQLGFTCGTRRRGLNCFLPPPPELRRREGLWSKPAKPTDGRKYYLKFVVGGGVGRQAEETPVPVESEY